MAVELQHRLFSDLLEKKNFVNSWKNYEMFFQNRASVMINSLQNASQMFLVHMRQKWKKIYYI